MRYQDLDIFEQGRCFNVFVMFVNRHHPDFTLEQLGLEFNRITACKDEREYFRASRIGEDFTLDRVMRRDLYSLYTKALNNEAFIREAGEANININNL